LVFAAPAASSAPGRRDGALLLFSSLALGLLALSGMSLLGMLMQLGRAPQERPAA
jgi:hypothetical protein